MTSAEDRRTLLRAAFGHADLGLEQLWLRYFELGGDGDLFDLEAHLDGLASLPDVDGDLLAVAVNERLDELSAARRVPYSRPLRPPRPTTGPLAALLHLLEAARSAPPDRLGPLAAHAGRVLGVDVAVHVVDHEQRWLLRLPDGRTCTEPVAVDGTLPGRVFQAGRLLPSEAGGVPRLWVPLLDGADRMGVLEVRVAAARDLEDPDLREQCEWLASMVAHLVTSMGVYGDVLERTRRGRPRSPSAELVWQQLPPLTAATDSFVLAGLLEPSADVGGDAFDYALGEDAVWMTVLDAMGHGLGAGLMSAASLAAARSTRRAGRGIHDQARAIDEVIGTTFPGSAFVTGVLAELDVTSGRLRYVRAGHPPPLLLRDGRVVKELSAGGRVPFGLETAGFGVAEEVLEPGDWLVLYTDGITEARDAAGRWFGEQRLVEFLTRAAAAGQPPPETVRRLVHAVLNHQDGVLQDDASILVASWAER
ncbi:Stage II sporulation protein E (SpoIIE) [Geodermatophilus dictyosporus]|uniref:Stage II sporulation protein E (SpoIIE) n=1 Tax=Geodermatophilus dictyosporus TaxID=1523247 RepID=A0A1I5Q4N3_9ACTN|nr:PP2C family protein-serine/threonine phosphatase [Geodermatophilus dictyosporus]SFP41243.1 Stage II sporulation protein E (SpoIIE) [Geodermatophilus dictyosporus]